MKMITEIETMKITSTIDNGNIECRVHFDEGGKVACIAEMKIAEGLTPADFKGFFKEWVQVILKVNPLLMNASQVDEDEGC